MQALLLTANRKFELVDTDRPQVGPRDVLIRVAACGICGSDVHGYDGSSGRRTPPIVMGHEAAGVIAEVGADVQGVSVGERVTFDSTIYCGKCEACRRGDVNLCPQRRVLGVSCADYRQNGAFAEYVAVPDHILHRLPADLSMEHAAMIEPVAIALHAVARLRVVPGERAVVVGSGMIGLLVIQALKHAGCAEVIAVDIDAGKLKLAEELGATATIDASNLPLPSGEGRGEGALSSMHAVAPARAILELTNGEGVDIAAEVVGNAKALATAIACVRRGGRVGLVGNLSAEVPMPLQSVVTREVSLIGCCASAGEYPQAIELVASGAIRVEPLISALAPLAEGQEWFDRLYAREPGLMKVVLQPSTDLK